MHNTRIHQVLISVNNKFREKRFFRITKKILLGILFLFLFFFCLNLFFPLHINLEYSTIVTAKDGTVLKAYLTSDEKWRMYTELDEITPEMQKAIVFKEDKYFYLHPGVNPISVLRAFFNNLIHGRRTSGASTITMQVARLIDPKNRTYGNKIWEMFRALQIDMLYSKEEILQMYLNLVPYGGNIEGVKAASVIYLEKNPSVLSLAELTALSIIPNRPTTLRPGINNDVIVSERNRWLMRFKSSHLFPEEIIDDALHEPFNAFRTEGPDMAQHFCNRMKQQFPGNPIIKTNLNSEIQMQSEKILSSYVTQLWGLDIHNGAAIIIDNKTHQVVSYVGSADFYDTFDAGQVDGVRAVRSPGSTLKPILYALGFDKGILTPQTIIADVPVNYSGYSPENYDEDYHGNVSVEFALSHSLNVPAVKSLDKIGLNLLTDKLIDCNFKSIEENKKGFGLSLVLGGCGVTLEELTGLYAAFANQGIYQPIKYLQNDNDTTSVKVISDAAAYMVTEILIQLTRPDLPNFYQQAKNVPLVAWKTGTSYGRKDAWSIGYNNNYTIGVWIGNFSGKGVPELSGANVATPLLFNLFNAIEKENNKEWNRMPEGVDFRYVCSVSGKLPNDFCNNVVIDYYIPGISPNEKCDHLIPVKISPDEKISYCTTCAPETGYKEKLYENYSPEIIAWMQMKNIPYTTIPEHNAKCERIFSEGGPTITSPVNQLEYYIDKLDKQKIMLQANVAHDVKTVYWYLNNKLISKSAAGEAVFIDPMEGKLKISCSDDKGRNSNIEVSVVFF